MVNSSMSDLDTANDPVSLLVTGNLSLRTNAWSVSADNTGGTARGEPQQNASVNSVVEHFFANERWPAIILLSAGFILAEGLNESDLGEWAAAIETVRRRQLGSVFLE